MNKVSSASRPARSISSMWASAMPYVAWPLFGLLVAFTCWFFIFQVLHNERSQFEKQVYEIASKVAENQAAQVASNLTMIDQILLLVRIHWVALDGKLEVSQLENIVTSDGNALSIAVFNSNGELIFTNTPDAWSSQDLRDIPQMPFFKVQERASDDEMFIGMPRKLHEKNDFAVRFSRKIIDTNGKFSGIVAVLLDDDSLIAKFDYHTLGKQGFVGQAHRREFGCGLTLLWKLLHTLRSDSYQDGTASNRLNHSLELEAFCHAPIELTCKNSANGSDRQILFV